MERRQASKRTLRAHEFRNPGTAFSIARNARRELQDAKLSSGLDPSAGGYAGLLDLCAAPRLPRIKAVSQLEPMKAVHGIERTLRRLPPTCRSTRTIFLECGWEEVRGPIGVLSSKPPAMTPWAQARYDAAKPGLGPRAQPLGNDPMMTCDPLGYPRIAHGGAYPMEFVQTKDRLIEFFDFFYVLSTIWLDGRKLPDRSGTNVVRLLGRPLGRETR